MEVHLNRDVQASSAGLPRCAEVMRKMLAREAIERFVDYDEWFVSEVEKGLTQIERGEVLTHAEVGTRLENLLTEKPRL
jgi:predicted transcriptional regulator